MRPFLYAGAVKQIPAPEHGYVFFSDTFFDLAIQILIEFSFLGDRRLIRSSLLIWNAEYKTLSVSE